MKGDASRVARKAPTWSANGAVMSKPRCSLKYIPLTFDVSITLNGESLEGPHPFDTISEVASASVVDETDLAYYALQPAESNTPKIEIYSNDLYVTSIDGVGIEGTVVTKRILDVDMPQVAVDG